MKIKKYIFIFTLIFFSYLINSFVKWQEIEYFWENQILFSGNLIWIENNQSDVWFKYWWNNFWWLFFITDIETLINAEVVKLWWNDKTCKKRINWFYYNNQRWLRFWPLDLGTLNTLKSIAWNYDNVQINWWFFTDCESSPNNRIYGNITHNIWENYYELIAGVNLNFWRNTYLNFWWITNLPKLWQELLLIPWVDWLFLSWHIFDNYWWIWIVLWSWICIDTRQINPNKICDGEMFIQYSNCWNTKIAFWKKKCDKNHLSAWMFCKYDDEQYLEKWIFKDTKAHRWFNYIEIMRKSCLHRGKETNLWLRTYYPDDYIKKSEVLKTLVKIRWLEFDNFWIESEDKEYPYSIIFKDIDKNNRFSWYANYAFGVWLTDWLYSTKDNNKYLNPEKYLNRYQTIQKLVETYNLINWQTITINKKTNLTDINKNNPYYTYIRQAESMWIIKWYKQIDWTYKFEWERYITRAEFAKIISIPFSLLLLWYEQ